LTTALYEETEENKYSSVVALIKERDVDKIKSFEDFRGKRACFPEYGGIASVAFINVAKSFKIFKREECNFGEILGEFFNQSCLPGANNIFHDPKFTNSDSLCRLCQTNLYHTSTTERIVPLAGAINEDSNVEYEKATTDGIEGGEEDIIPFNPDRSINCAASNSNRFYGTKGALTCLNEVGDIAVLEHQNLLEHATALKINPNDFRILCRNGSLADQPGFDVDPSCFLTTIVDGEIIIRRNNTMRNAGIINALLSLDAYLKTDPDFKMYNIFNGEKNLLFEDSALGLVSPNDTQLSQSVQNYIQLFANVENCISETGSAPQITFNLILSFSLIVFTVLIID
jgi:Transferrin